MFLFYTIPNVITVKYVGNILIKFYFFHNHTLEYVLYHHHHKNIHLIS